MKKNRLLERNEAFVKSRAIDFRGYSLDHPKVHNGITFYDVGQNATEDFALGVDEHATIWVCVTSEDGSVDIYSEGKDPNDIGYIGHH